MMNSTAILRNTSSKAFVAPTTSTRSLSLLTLRTRHFLPSANYIKTHPHRPFQLKHVSNMSSYSNADTGSKPADPYKEKNVDNASLKDKVQDLTAFIEKTKLCLMTTLVADTTKIATRAMALAATVSFRSEVCSEFPLMIDRKEMVLTCFSTQTPSLARPMTSRPIPISILDSSPTVEIGLPFLERQKLSLTATPFASTILHSSRRGLGISVMESTMVAQRIQESC